LEIEKMSSSLMYTRVIPILIGLIISVLLYLLSQWLSKRQLEKDNQK